MDKKFNPNNPAIWKNFNPFEEASTEYIDGKSEAYVKRAKAARARAQDPEWLEKMKEINQAKAKDSNWIEKHKNILKELADKSQDPEWLSNRINTIKNFWNSNEGKIIKELRNKKLSKLQEDFWNSDKGNIAREKKSQSRKAYYQTEKGKEQLTKSRDLQKGISKPYVTLALKGKPKPKVTCPHCGFEGGGGVMHRYHFDNCKKKPV